ncbi:hypothetical protein, partial [Streptococcus sobrinus]|uniref:hypothetical protein n=1 Tax=Streptococcus sobrinus TaxID=1310 RepID=UPI001C3F8F89
FVPSRGQLLYSSKHTLHCQQLCQKFFKKFHQLSKFAQRFPRNYQKQVFLMSSHKKRLLAKSF